MHACKHVDTSSKLKQIQIDPRRSEPTNTGTTATRMLNNLWSQVTGDNNRNWNRSITQKNSHKNVLSDDETAILTENDDEAADILLSQFPTFGTNTSQDKVGSTGGSYVQYQDDDKEEEEEGHQGRILLQSRLSVSHGRHPEKNKEQSSLSAASANTNNHKRNRHSKTALQSSERHFWSDEEEDLWTALGNNPTKHSQLKKSQLQSKRKQQGDHRNHHPSHTPSPKNTNIRRAWVDGNMDVTANNNSAHNNQAKKTDASASGTINSYLLSPRSPFAANKESRASLASGSNIGEASYDDNNAKSFSFLKKKGNDDKQHWMPDQLCKQCYSCDVPFTVFRRRHHCRVCGQVFCSSCSAYFCQLPPSAATVSGFEKEEDEANANASRTMRVCEMCFENSGLTLMAAAAAAISQPGANKKEGMPTSTSSSIMRNSTDQRNNGTNGGPVSSPSPSNGTSTGEALSNLHSKVVIASSEEDSSSRAQTSIVVDRKQQQATLPDAIEKHGNSVIQSLSKQNVPQEAHPIRNPLDRLAKHLEQSDPLQDNSATSLASRLARTLTSGDTTIKFKNSSGGYSTDQTSLQQSDMADPGIMEQVSQNQQLISKTVSRDAEETAAAAAKKPSIAANRHLGLMAASHLELICKELLKSDAPLLLQEQAQKEKQWINALMTLATRCCATVDPNVKKGDLLDIRPYCKIKTIAGGSHKDCAYMSGVVFRKNVSHKRMAREIENPRIMLLSGGIEFTRTENRIASFDTLVEQEEKYMEILVGKILKYKPDILLVGKSVSRKALELFLCARVVLVQHVKSALMSRISRQTGATVISSTDHVMNTFGENVLGRCRRFRLVTFRDNEVWVDDSPTHGSDNSIIPSNRKNHTSVLKRKLPKAMKQHPKVIKSLLADQKLSNPERQAALAANVLGESVLDGSEAVRTGLAKRGVAQTFVMLEGCPKHLGCTVVLRGARRASLKQVKRVFRFLINVAYNLRLETSYLRERCAKLPEAYQVRPENLFSSSLCVDYGGPPKGRKVVPWNGRSNEPSQRSISGDVTALDHTSILITSVWMTDKIQCCPAEVKGICCYSLQDVSLGQFLRDSCFNLSLKCQNSTCKKSVLDHSLSFIHNDGIINITVEQMDDPLPPPPPHGDKVKGGRKDSDTDLDTGSPIATWTYCTKCSRGVTPLIYISEDTWKYSFGKFLESFFYNRDVEMNSPDHGCSCQMQSGATLYFGCGRLAARFTYESVKPFGVFVRRSLPMDDAFHRFEALHHLEQIGTTSSKLFVDFDKHIMKVSREARSLFGSAANRPEHLQTVLAELGTIGSEVDHASKTLQEKISSVSDKCRQSMQGGGMVNEALFRFPWYSRRYLFMLTSVWNERLSAVGEAISAMKKLAASQVMGGSRGDIVPTIVGDASIDALQESMRHLRQLHDIYAQVNVTDITTMLPMIPGNETFRRASMEYDDDFDGEFASDGIDADVLASRRRFQHNKPSDSLTAKADQDMEGGGRGPSRTTLGTPAPQHRFDDDPKTRRKRDPSPVVPSMQNSQALARNKTVTPNAVKSAINRFFNRVGKEMDPYVVDLGMFKEGRPRLDVGVGGIVIPVMDDQPSTVIAYSLSSVEYSSQFQQFSKAEGNPEEEAQMQDNSTNNATGVSESTTSVPRRKHHKQNGSATTASSIGSSNAGSHDGGVGGVYIDEKKDIERRMLVRNKSHIKHTFRDHDEKGQQTCKFVCTAYWATQFHAVRKAFLMPKDAVPPSTPSNRVPSPSLNKNNNFDVEKSFIKSLSSSTPWAASGGKSGASFARTADERFVIKYISRTELQMFLDCAPAYFEYLSKAFFHGLPTVLCKIVGVYQIGSHDRITGKHTMEQVAVMQNIFYGRKISKIFDLKGSLRGRFAKDKVAATVTISRSNSDSENNSITDDDDNNEGEVEVQLRDKGFEQSALVSTLLDGDFLEFTNGRPLPLTDRAKAVFHMSVLNDTLFLSIINVLDYSILVGIDEERMELVVGIIDFMRQYDILKQMERVGKSLPMVVGSEAPTIIQPPLYKARFTNAMERYFMTVPNKWTVI